MVLSYHIAASPKALKLMLQGPKGQEGVVAGSCHCCHREVFLSLPSF